MERRCAGLERSTSYRITGYRPLFFAACFYLAGILISEATGLGAVIPAATAVAALALFLILRRKFKCMLLKLLAILFAGMAAFSYFMDGTVGTVKISGKVVGTVCDVSMREDGGATYMLKDASVDGQKVAFGIFLTSERADFLLSDVIEFEG